MHRLYFARFLCAGWALTGFVWFFICWGIEKRENIDMSSFRSNEVILFVICLGLVWLLLHTIIRKYDKGEPPVKKTTKEKRVLKWVFGKAIRRRFDGDSRAIRII